MTKTKYLFLFLVLSALLSLSCVCFAQNAENSDNNFFEEDFSDDFNNHSWEKYMLLGDPNGAFYHIQRHRLSFELPTRGDVNMIFYNTAFAPSNVRVQAEFENIRFTSAAYSVICRFTKDGWYELRVNAGGSEAGSYKLLKYDAYMKEKGFNPYTTVHKGMDRYFSNDINLRVGGTNKLELICYNDSFRVFINDVEQIPSKNNNVFSDDIFTEGSVGFSGLSFNDFMTEFDITHFEAEVYEP